MKLCRYSYFKTGEEVYRLADQFWNKRHWRLAARNQKNLQILLQITQEVVYLKHHLRQRKKKDREKKEISIYYTMNFNWTEQLYTKFLLNIHVFGNPCGGETYGPVKVRFYPFGYRLLQKLPTNWTAMNICRWFKICRVPIKKTSKIR